MAPQADQFDFEASGFDFSLVSHSVPSPPLAILLSAAVLFIYLSIEAFCFFYHFIFPFDTLANQILHCWVAILAISSRCSLHLWMMLIQLFRSYWLKSQTITLICSNRFEIDTELKNSKWHARQTDSYSRTETRDTVGKHNTSANQHFKYQRSSFLIKAKTNGS